MTVYFPNTQLPWSSSVEEDSRFKRLQAIALGLLAVVVLAVSVVTLPELPREEKEKLPPQLARIVLEQQELPVPVVEPPKVEEKKPEEIKPEEPQPAEQLLEEKLPEPKPVEPRPEPVKTVEQARATAQASGLLQFQDDFMAMRDVIDTSTIESSAALSRGEATATQVDRSAVTSGVTTTSGGINNAALSRDTGGVALSGRETTQVTSELASATQQAAERGSTSGEGGKTRSEEEMSKVMDQHKGAIFQIYNRALRQNAALQGRVVLDIIIEPSGAISDVVIITSELNDAELEAALIRRIRMINFTASATVIRTTLRQTFDFLPQ
jgi:protein TonB